MPHTCSCFCSEEVSARRFEELEDGLVLPYGRVCDIDYDLCSGQCVSQTFSCNCVDARGGRARHNFVTILPKVVHELCADETGFGSMESIKYSFDVQWIKADS